MGRLWPRAGGALAVLEAARNVACTGPRPIGLTNCLNFGNPGEGRDQVGARRVDQGDEPRPARRCACWSSRATSRLQRTDGRGSTPPRSSAVLGCSRTCMRYRRVARGRRDPARRSLAGRAARLRVPGALGAGRRPPARLDLAAEASLVEFLWRAASQCSLVHDVSHGGLAVALAEAAIHSQLGADLTLPTTRAPGSARVGGRPCWPARPKPSTGSAASDPAAQHHRRRQPVRVQASTS